jgi:hypothetical protein
MPEQQTVNPPVNSNSGSSSSQDTNQSTPKVDDTIDELLQGEEEREKKKSWIDSMLEAAKRRNMALRGISQKDLEEGRTPESVKHLYTITSEELLNPHKARDFVTRGSKFIREERQKEKDTMLAGPTYEYEHDNIIYKGMRVPSGRSVPLTKEEIRKGYVKGATIYEQKYQITHDDPTYIKDYFFRTGKHPAQDPNSNWTPDERREGKQSWQPDEVLKEWWAKRARDARDPAIKEANEWLESDEGRKAEKNISDSYQVKIDTLLEEEEANKWGHRFSRRDYYDRYKKLRQEEYDAINQLKSDRANQHESRIGKEGVPAKEGRIQPGIRGGGVEAGSPDDVQGEALRQQVIDVSQNATQTVHSNVSQQKEKQMYQDAVDRAASGPVADGPANTNVKLPRGEHQAPVVEEPQPVEELTPLRLSPDSGRDKLLPHIEQLLPPEPPPAHIISELNNQQQDNRDVDAAIAPIQAGFISGPPASNTVEDPTWGLREWTTLGLMGETARQLSKTVSNRRFRKKADAPAPTDTSGKSAKVRPLGTKWKRGTKWNPLNWRRTMPGGTINPSGKPRTPIELPPELYKGVPRPPGYEGRPISVSGGDAPVPEFTPEQIAHQREYQQRHAESIKRRRAAAKAAEAKRKTTLPTVDLTPAPEVATDYYETKWEEFKRKIQTPTQARLDAVELELPPRTFDATPKDAAKTKKVLSDINADLAGPTHMEQTIENAGYGDSGDGKRKTPSHSELTREYAGDPGDYIPPEELLDAPSPEEIREINAAKQADADFDRKYVQDDLFDEAHNKKIIEGITEPNDIDRLLNEIEKDVKPKGKGKDTRLGSTGGNITKEDLMAAAKGVKSATTKVRNVINQNPGGAKAGLILSLLGLAASHRGNSWDWGDLFSSDAWAGANIGGAFADAGKAMIGMDTTGSVTSNYAIPGMTSTGMDMGVLAGTALRFPGEALKGAKGMVDTLTKGAFEGLTGEDSDEIMKAIYEAKDKAARHKGSMISRWR